MLASKMLALCFHICKIAVSGYFVRCSLFATFSLKEKKLSNSIEIRRLSQNKTRLVTQAGLFIP
jgi:hypothetical protein